MDQKRGMLSRAVGGQWKHRETARALRSQHELNKAERQNAVMGCGTCCNVI
jgi:hypothetical protein